MLILKIIQMTDIPIGDIEVIIGSLVILALFQHSPTKCVDSGMSMGGVHIIQQIYEYQNKGLLFICGDFNSRCGDNDDFISGIDSIKPRNDFNTNLYGDHLIQFLIDCNMCILNGRNYTVNDFTSVSVKGCSVVDYCLVSHEHLHHFTDFNVIRTIDLINKIGVRNILPRNMPDHSVLSWNMHAVFSLFR